MSVSPGRPSLDKPSSEVLAKLANDLHAFLGDRSTTSESVRDHHSRGESYHAAAPPDIVCFPQSTEEVSAIVRISAAAGAPMVPFGAGTSLEGHVSALAGGVTIDLSRMTRIVRVTADDLDATVEAGVTHMTLNHALRNTGLFFPIDPGADATLGGMAATRASGTTAVRYGTMRENVLGLKVVLADGEVITTGGRARKSAAGYDLTRLFVGSEGTLGVITEVTVKLHGRPEAVSAAVCSFPTLEAAVTTVISTIQLGIPVARIELLDEIQMDAVNRFSRLSYPVAPTLFFEFHGASEASVSEQARAVEELAAGHGAADFQWATTREERATLWHARHQAYYAALALKPGSRAWTTDVSVPISRLAECILESKRDNERSFLVAPLVGHAGDGNFHLIYLLDPASPEELAEASRLNDRLVERALRLGGTCTGEHGVGFGKMHALADEHGAGLGVMRAIKRALDPRNLMNPGKIVNMDPGSAHAPGDRSMGGTL
jgi:D-lactate dehydrogenase (cytochrome)